MKLWVVEWQKNEDWIFGQDIVAAMTAREAKEFCSTGEVDEPVELKVVLSPDTKAGVVLSQTWHKS